MGSFFKRQNDLPNPFLLKGKRPNLNKVKKSTKAQRKRERRFMEMEICLEVQQEIDEGRLPNCAICEISISDVLTALRNEPGGSKTLSYFESTKGGSKSPRYLEF